MIEIIAKEPLLLLAVVCLICGLITLFTIFFMYNSNIK